MQTNVEVRTETRRGRSRVMRSPLRQGCERILRGGVWAGFHLAAGRQRWIAPLEEADLLRTAQRSAGGGTFADTSFLEGLRSLLQSLQNGTQLNLLGQITARQNILRLLANLLRLEQDRVRYPEIPAQEVPRPVFITGLPRSGSTLLHRLLAEDPASRVPQNWEMLDPSPPPERVTYARDPRIAGVERKMHWFHFLAPRFRRIHDSDARSPEECVMILAHSFLATQFCSMFGVPSYQAWLSRQSLVPAYRLHRRFLQHLQVHCAGDRWVLKAPTHLLGLRALLEVYPDACVIMTHREPLEVLASEASLQTTLRGIFTRKADPLAIGREVTESIAAAIRRGLEVRDQGCAPPEQFVDVRYPDLMRDPIGAVRGIYGHFGLRLTQDAEARMRSFLARHPKDRHGTHAYSLGAFGLEAAEETERYAAYRDRFALHG